MQIFTELKNNTDKIITAKFDGAELMFKPGESKDIAYFFPADMIPTILSRFQIKYGLTLIKITPIDPIPEPAVLEQGNPIVCTCGEPEKQDVVHRTDGPCYVKEKKAKKR